MWPTHCYSIEFQTTHTESDDKLSKSKHINKTEIGYLTYYFPNKKVLFLH